LPTKLEERLELLENALIAALAGGGGLVAGAELQKFLPRYAPRAAPVARLGGAAASAAVRGLAGTPTGRAVSLAAIAYGAHKAGLSVGEAAGLIEEEVENIQEGQRFVSPLLTPVPRALMDPGAAIPRYKRKVSKANKAVKHAMSLLKAGPKRSTGADKGKLAKGAFKIAVKAAGLANPKTKSKIGKGKGKVKALARKIRKWW
jgi:hypothetical protein